MAKKTEKDMVQEENVQENDYSEADQDNKQDEEVIQMTKRQLLELIEATIEEREKKKQVSVANGYEISEEEKMLRERKAYYDELVTINVFMDNDKYKDDLIVPVNGKTWQIRRGEDVRVPRYVAAVIENSMKQDKATTAKIRSMEQKYERESR